MKRRPRQFAKMLFSLFVMCLTGHITAHADIDSANVLPQLKKNFAAALAAAKIEVQKANTNAAFKIFDLAAFIPFEAEAVLENVNIEAKGTNSFLSSLFDESNITARTPTELIYTVTESVCASLVESESEIERLRSVPYMFCKATVADKSIRMSIISSDNLTYNLLMQSSGLHDDSFTTITSTISSPNSLGTNISLTELFALLKKVALANPIMAGSIEEVAKGVTGKIGSLFVFSTSEMKANCNHQANACLVLNVIEPMQAEILDDKINLKMWEASPLDNPTAQFFSLDNGILLAEINQGALSVAGDIFEQSFDFSLGRLKAKVTINPSVESQNSSEESPNIMIQNLCLESAVKNRLELSTQEFNLDINNGTAIDLVKFWCNPNSFVSVSPHKCTVEILNSGLFDRFSLTEKLEVNVSGNEKTHMCTYAFDQKDPNDVCTHHEIKLPQVETKYMLSDLFNKMMVSNCSKDSSVGVISGLLEIAYEFGLKMSERDIDKLGQVNMSVPEGYFISKNQ